MKNFKLTNLLHLNGKPYGKKSQQKKWYKWGNEMMPACFLGGRKQGTQPGAPSTSFVQWGGGIPSLGWVSGKARLFWAIDLVASSADSHVQNKCEERHAAPSVCLRPGKKHDPSVHSARNHVCGHLIRWIGLDNEGLDRHRGRPGGHVTACTASL